MAGTRLRKIAHTHVGISEQACYAWQRGDKHGFYRAMDIMPFDPSPFTIDSAEPPEWVMAREDGAAFCPRRWARSWEIRCAMLELAGPPGPSGPHGEPLGVVLPPSERWR
jgi:hypothetical protein